MNKKKKVKIGFPHSFILMFGVIILAAIMTHIIPAGEYTRIENSSGINVVDPTSFHYVEQNGASIMDVFKAVPEGMSAVSGLLFFILIVGGAFQIINATGAMNAAINRLVTRLGKNDLLVIPIFMLIFACASATMGVTDECLAFVPLGIMVARSLGYDSIVGTFMVMMGVQCGFVSGPLNPWNVGIAQSIAELPMYSGIGLRLALMITMLITGSLFIMSYAKKVKACRQKSMVYELEIKKDAEGQEDTVEFADLTVRHIFVLLTFVAGLAYVIYGVITKGWGISDMSPVFLAIGLIAGLIGGLTPNEVAKEFINGAKGLTFGIIIIGTARGIMVILTNGMILDTIIHAMAVVLTHLPSQFTAVGMYLMQIMINFVIVSGSGQAAATMPVMSPLADLTGVNRQIAVLAFQLGDGITNSINLQSSTMNTYLSISGIDYPKWFKFIIPLIITWLLIGLVFLFIATAINYGPF